MFLHQTKLRKSTKRLVAISEFINLLIFFYLSNFHDFSEYLLASKNCWTSSTWQSLPIHKIEFSNSSQNSKTKDAWKQSKKFNLKTMKREVINYNHQEKISKDKIILKVFLSCLVKNREKAYLLKVVEGLKKL